MENLEDIEKHKESTPPPKGTAVSIGLWLLLVYFIVFVRLLCVISIFFQEPHDKTLFLLI